MTLTSILAGTHLVAQLLAQGYGPPPPGWYGPRWQRPYEYDRPYQGPFRDRDVVHPDEQRFNRDMYRFRRYSRPEYGPYRPY